MGPKKNKCRRGARRLFPHFCYPIKIDAGWVIVAESVFDRLVQELSPSQRKDLLRQIDEKTPVPEEPLRADEPDGGAIDLEDVYRRLGLWARILIFIKMLFTGRRREDILERELLGNLARDIQKRSSGIMDFSQGMFLPSFCEQMHTLKEAVEVFVLPLREASGQNKAEFIAFLAGLYMEDLQDRLLREVDPYYQILKFLHGGDVSFSSGEWENRQNMEIPPSSELSDGDVKRMMETGVEEALAVIPRDGKSFLYEDMKTFCHLVNLSQYSFDRLISAFSSGPEGSPAPCPLHRIKDQLVRLAEIMCSMKASPSAFMLRALFLFCGAEISGAVPEGRVVRQIAAAVRALERIRETNRRIPWTAIARYVTRNMNYRCAVSGGAEDWFALLKQFWRGRIEACCRSFGARRKEKELRADIRAVFAPLPVREVENYLFPVDGVMAGGSFSLSLSLVKTFVTGLFAGEMGRHLKSVLIDGVFYKEDNRKEFTDGYNAIQKASSILEKFEARLAPNGDIALAVAAVADPREYTPAAIKHRKILAVIKETDLDAEYLLQTVQGGLGALSKVLNGILYGEIGGKYDTLSNLPEMGGRANAEFRKGVDEALRKINAVNTLLQKLITIEKAWLEKRESGEKERGA
jgi:hypothetical protein